MPPVPARRQRRRQRKKQRNAKFGMSLDPVPQTKMVKHRYSQFINIDPAIGNSTAVFNLSHMHDPDFTGGGHQPYGYDTFNSLYKEYIVVGAKVTATCVNNDISYPLVFCTQIRDSVTAELLDINNMIEQGKSSYIILSDQQAQTPRKIFAKYSAKSFWGVTDIKDDDDLKGRGSTAPVKQAYCHISVQSLNTAVDPANTSVHVLVEYVAVWRTPELLAQS